MILHHVGSGELCAMHDHEDMHPPACWGRRGPAARSACWRSTWVARSPHAAAWMPYLLGLLVSGLRGYNQRGPRPLRLH